MTIGIPRSLYYYRYQTLIKAFFNELGINYVISSVSTKQTLESGKTKVSDESCICLKLFMGHIKDLENKCDCVLVPYLKCIKKNEKMCTNFYLLYDLVRNTFDKNIIDFSIDEDNLKSEKISFIRLGLFLGNSYNKTVNAYKNAKDKEKKVLRNKIKKQNEILKNNNKKILIAGHPYTIYDEYLGKPLIKILKENKIDIIYSDIYDKKCLEKDALLISKDVYWSLNKEIIGAVSKYKPFVDGIILVTAFPCGTDSITNELIKRKVDIPIINIILDEQTSKTGIITRLESFIDIIYKEEIYE